MIDFLDVGSVNHRLAELMNNKGVPSTGGVDPFEDGAAREGNPLGALMSSAHRPWDSAKLHCCASCWKFSRILMTATATISRRRRGT